MALPRLGMWLPLHNLFSVNIDILVRLDVMASTSSLLEQGYEKIFRWCSYEFQQIGRDTQLEIGAIMQEAIRRLRKRPELLR
jgi:Conserved oligomeric complex COG6